MAFEVEGKLHRVFATEQKSQSFQTREFVLEIPDGNYPQLVKFQAVQDRCTILDQFREGDKVRVSFDLRGREWNGKYLTNLNAWRIQAATGEPSGNSGANDGGNAGNNAARGGNDERFPADPFPNYTDTPQQNVNMDDLPF